MKLTGFLSLLLSIGVANAGAPVSPTKASSTSAKTSGKSVSPASARKMLLRQEQKFMQNKGQWDDRAKFCARTLGMDMWFEDRGIDFDYYMTSGPRLKRSRTGQVVRMEFPGGTGPVNYSGNDPLGDHIDFLYGKKTVRGVSSFGNVTASAIYP